jgi:hypothetical protein
MPYHTISRPAVSMGLRSVCETSKKRTLVCSFFHHSYVQKTNLTNKNEVSSLATDVSALWWYWAHQGGLYTVGLNCGMGYVSSCLVALIGMYMNARRKRACKSQSSQIQACQIQASSVP